MFSMLMLGFITTISLSYAASLCLIVTTEVIMDEAFFTVVVNASVGWPAGS